MSICRASANCWNSGYSTTPSSTPRQFKSLCATACINQGAPPHEEHCLLPPICHISTASSAQADWPVIGYLQEVAHGRVFSLAPAVRHVPESESRWAKKQNCAANLEPPSGWAPKA